MTMNATDKEPKQVTQQTPFQRALAQVQAEREQREQREQAMVDFFRRLAADLAPLRAGAETPDEVEAYLRGGAR